VPLAVHALDIDVVVLSLRSIALTLCRVGATHAADQQAGTGTDTGTPMVAADRCTCHGTNNCSDHGIAYGWIIVWAAHLLRGVLTALHVVVAECVVIAVSTWQDQNAGAGWYAGTSAEQHQCGGGYDK